jgi:hypothetical protein
LSGLNHIKKLALVAGVCILGLINSGCVNSAAEEQANFTITDVHKIDNTIAITIIDKTDGAIDSHWTLERSGKTIELDGSKVKITLPIGATYKVNLNSSTVNGTRLYSRTINVNGDGIV